MVEVRGEEAEVRVAVVVEKADEELKGTSYEVT